MTSSPKKGDISRSNLESHGIYYDENAHRQNLELPEHVEVIRDILLSFPNTAPDQRWQMEFQNEAEKYEMCTIANGYDTKRNQLLSSALQPIPTQIASYMNISQQPNACDDMDSSKKIAIDAREYGAQSEATWNTFWQKNIFLTANDIPHTQPGFHPLLDKWSLEGNCMWTEFSKLEPQNKNLCRRTAPKPDYTYAFPVQNPTPQGLERDEFNKTFSVKTLTALNDKGYCCTPTSGIRKKTPGSHDLTCFPWAVVEIKKEKPPSGGEEKCYCQAANASAAALEIRSPLFMEYIDSSSEGSDVPPVIAFTCIGHVVKVWLTFFEKKKDGETNKHMVCIWETSVLLTWGVATLREIVKNMHTWSSRLLKPKLQACLAIVVLKLPDQGGRCAGDMKKPRASSKEIPPRGSWSEPLAKTRDELRITPRNSTSYRIPKEDETPTRSYKRRSEKTPPSSSRSLQTKQSMQNLQKGPFMGSMTRGNSPEMCVNSGLTRQLSKSCLHDPDPNKNQPPRPSSRADRKTTFRPKTQSTPCRHANIEVIQISDSDS